MLISHSFNFIAMQKRDLGPLGETTFRKLCHTVGLTVHKSDMDRTGWDFLVEFPYEQSNQLPQDLLPAPLVCKIQVKSTDKQRKKEAITLSNLSNLVKAQMPAFFCFIEFDGGDEEKAIYLVHLGKEIIEKTLKRIREIENSRPRRTLNKHTLCITYRDADKLNDLTGKSLKEAIEKFVPDGMEKYIGDKNKILNTVGFEDGHYQATVTIMSDDPTGDFLDATLGIRKEINIHKFIGYHKRFGILSTEPEMIQQGGIVAIYSKAIKAELKFKESRFAAGISFPVELYISPLSKFIPQERLKFRIVSNFFELIFESNKINYSIYAYHNKIVSLRELTDFLNLLSTLEKTSQPITVELEYEGFKSSPIFSFSSEDLPSSLFEVNNLDSRVLTWGSIAKIAIELTELFKEIRIPEESLLISIKDLPNLSRSGDFLLLHQALCGGEDSLVISFSDEIYEYPQNAKAAKVCFAQARIGNYIIGYCLGIIGSISLLNDHHMLFSERFFIGQKFIKTDSTNITREQIEPGLNELVEALQNEEFEFISVSL